MTQKESLSKQCCWGSRLRWLAPFLGPSKRKRNIFSVALAIAFGTCTLASGYLLCTQTRAGLELLLLISERKAEWELDRLGVTKVQAKAAGEWGARTLNLCGTGQEGRGSQGNSPWAHGGAGAPGGARTSECACTVLIHGLGDQSMTYRRLLRLAHQRWAREKGNSEAPHPIKWVLYDLPGSPLTPLQSSELLAVRRIAQNLLLQLKNDTSCKRWTVVGNSFGGWVAQWMALEDPQAIAHLLLLNSAGLKRPTTQGLGWVDSPSVEALKDFQRRAYASPRRLSDVEWEVALERQKRGSAKQLARAQKEEDFLESRLSSLHTPTMLLWGVSDQVLPIEEGRKLHSLIPGAIWRPIENCGHLPQKECPEAVLDALEALIQSGAA